MSGMSGSSTYVVRNETFSLDSLGSGSSGIFSRGGLCSPRFSRTEALGEFCGVTSVLLWESRSSLSLNCS